MVEECKISRAQEGARTFVKSTYGAFVLTYTKLRSLSDAQRQTGLPI